MTFNTPPFFLRSVDNTKPADEYLGNPPPPGGGSEPPMELTERVAALEADMRNVREGVAVIKSNYATKEDLHREINAQTWKFIGVMSTIAVGLVGVTYYIASNIG
jgi:hypothetical protein